VVALSGGIDGEIACRAFMAAGIDFKVLTVKHKGGTNAHDTGYADKFCLANNLEQMIIELDVEDFFTVGKESYISRGYIAHNLFRYLQLFIMNTAEERGYCAVLGGGEQIYNADNNNIYVKYQLDFINSLRWIEENKTLHFPYFFQTTPEITAAYIQHPLIQLLTDNPRYFYSYSERYSAEKTLIYHEAWTEMERRTKFHGFENIQSLYARERRSIIERYPETSRLTIPLTTVCQQLKIS
jgi:hypothetical protein